MPYREEQFVNQEIYHIILRSIDDNLLFRDINDYYRGIFSIYEFNNDSSVRIWLRRRERKTEKIRELLQGPTLHTLDKRDKFVEILAFCFMPNHIHLLIKQIKENGIHEFMVKLGGGYGRYFNQKNNRKGYVFQNRFRSVHIKDDSQFKIVVPYIFTNPIALIYPGFKEKGIEDFNKVKEFLENYKWSNYQDCIGIKNFPSVTDREFLLEIMGGQAGCKDAVENWVRHKEEINQYPEVLLD